LQQLFRVRQPQHRADAPVRPQHLCRASSYRTLREDITPLRLSSDVSSRYFVSTQLSFFAQVKVTPTTVEYDRERLSWQIIPHHPNAQQ
jgi:hypothetical protein